MTAPQRIRTDDHLGTVEGNDALIADVRMGLGTRPYSLPPKWFYDALGSELFEQITRLEEYYPTEAERAALSDHATEIASLSGADTLVELGSGNSDKSRVLLDAMASSGQLTRYMPFDVSGDALRDAMAMIAERYPGIDVHGVVGDFDHHISDIPDDGHRLVAFLGGTIGNYDAPGRAKLLASLAAEMRRGESLLLGTDLVKAPERLVAAYDDRSGVTARFNLNLLTVLNTELGATFDAGSFTHRAVWNETEAWIEMRLRSLVAQTVAIPGADLVVPFDAGDEILTEISAKFTRPRIEAELAQAGLSLRGWFCDPSDDFALSLSVRE